MMKNVDEKQLPLRRRFRFSLAGLFGLLTTLSIALAFMTLFGEYVIAPILIGGAIVIIYCAFRGRYGLVALGMPLTFAVSEWRVFFSPNSYIWNSSSHAMRSFVLSIAISLLTSLVSLKTFSKHSGVKQYSLRITSIKLAEVVIIATISILLFASLLPLWSASGRDGTWMTDLWSSRFFVFHD